MSYKKQLHLASEWLVSIQRTDDGWGLASGQASSIVNTAEAIEILAESDKKKYHDVIEKGLNFLATRTLPSLRKNPNTRYAFFSLLAFSNRKLNTTNSATYEIRDWLVKAQNPDGGWGHTAKNDQSCLYPTVLSYIALTRLGKQKEASRAVDWIKSNRAELGWSLGIGEQPTHLASAMAVVALRLSMPPSDDYFVSVKASLLQASTDGLESENMPGTPWVHHKGVWISDALLSLGLEPYSTPIAEIVRKTNTLNCHEGWKEPHGHITVRGQYWAMRTFEAIESAFDPAIHPYRVDSAIAGAELTEPEFMRFFTHSKWSFAVPARLYKSLTYSLFFISLAAASGVHRLIPSKLDFIIAVVFFIIAGSMARARQYQFNKMFLYLMASIVAILSFVNLVFGPSVLNIYEKFRGLIGLAT
jgi:hypothetical protein